MLTYIIILLAGIPAGIFAAFMISYSLLPQNKNTIACARCGEEIAWYEELLFWRNKKSACQHLSDRASSLLIVSSLTVPVIFLSVYFYTFDSPVQFFTLISFYYFMYVFAVTDYLSYELMLLYIILAMLVTIGINFGFGTMAHTFFGIGVGFIYGLIIYLFGHLWKRIRVIVLKPFCLLFRIDPPKDLSHLGCLFGFGDTLLFMYIGAVFGLDVFFIVFVATILTISAYIFNKLRAKDISFYPLAPTLAIASALFPLLRFYL